MQNRIKASARELKTIYSLVMCALLIALYVALDFLSIYVTPMLQLTFSFLALGLLGYRFGYVSGCLAAIACDILSNIIRPQGPFHPGFTLSTVLTVLIFAVFLYERELKLWRVIISKTLINLVINIVINTYWLSNLFGKAYIVLLLERSLKNLISLPIDIFLLFFVLKAFEKINLRIRNK